MPGVDSEAEAEGIVTTGVGRDERRRRDKREKGKRNDKSRIGRAASAGYSHAVQEEDQVV